MAKSKTTAQAAPEQEVPFEAAEPPRPDSADIKPTEQAAPKQEWSFVAIEPLRLDGVDIEPGESFTATAKIAEPLIASGAASAAE